VMTAIETHQVTHGLLVPTMIGMLLNSPNFDPKRLSSLQYLLYGASPMPEGLLTTLIERMPDLKIVQGYGQTELAPIISTLQPEFHVLGSEKSKLRSAGRAAPARGLKLSMTRAIVSQPARLAKSSPAIWVSCKAIGNSKNKPPRP